MTGATAAAEGEEGGQPTATATGTLTACITAPGVFNLARLVVHLVTPQGLVAIPLPASSLAAVLPVP